MEERLEEVGGGNGEMGGFGVGFTPAMDRNSGHDHYDPNDHYDHYDPNDHYDHDDHFGNGPFRNVSHTAQT